jgi:diguanylate cyclase (GGDEF)-like protein
MTYSIINIKYLTLESHFWLEKYLHGDKEELSKVDTYLKKSFNEVDTLLNGGMIRGLQYNPMYNDGAIVNLLKKVKQQLLDIQSLKEELTKTDNYMVLDIQFDQKFGKLANTLNEVDDYTTEKFKIMFSNYTNIKYSLYVSIVLLLVFGFYLIRRFNKEIEDKIFLSYIDTLTKVQNLKGYKNEILKLLVTFKRYKIPFSVIMLDIDNFKQINDTFGHRVGDIVLMDISQLINDHIRQNIDTLFRVGGEEFLILCPNTSLNQGIQLAEKIREEVEKNLVSIKDKTLTISIGVTEMIEDDTEDSIYKRVDKYLYHSKKNGKNRVTSDLDESDVASLQS